MGTMKHIRPDLLVSDLGDMHFQISWSELLPPVMVMVGLVSLPFITLGIRKANIL